MCSEHQIKNNCHTFSSTKILEFKVRYLESKEKIPQKSGADLGERDNMVSDEFQKLPRSLQWNQNTSLVTEENTDLPLLFKLPQMTLDTWSRKTNDP